MFVYVYYQYQRCNRMLNVKLTEFIFKKHLGVSGITVSSKNKDVKISN